MSDTIAAVIAILVIFLGIPLGILFLRDILERVNVRNPMFWGFAPILLLFGIVMPMLIEGWTATKAILMAGMDACIVFALLGLYDARRFFWAFRGLTAVIFLAYLSYAIDECFFTGKPLTVGGRRSEASPRNALLGLAVIGLPCLWFALRGRFTFRAEPSPEQLAAERQAYEDQILQPDWEFYERHLQRPPPPALRELYADRALVTAVDLDYAGGNGLSTFNPLHEQGLLDTREQVGCDVIAFATSDCGDPIYLRPGPSEADTVFITYHDEDVTKVFAESVAVMLERLRHANRTS